jgi:hypothetical protein
MVLWTRPLSALLLVIFGTATALADSPHDHTQFGRDIVISADEEASDVTCFGCSVRVRGVVDTDVTTFGGNVVVEDGAEIKGDTTSFGGDVRLDHGSVVNAITVFGGRIHRDSRAAVNGDVTTFPSSLWLMAIFGLPLAILGAFIALVIWVVRRLYRTALPATA